MAIEFQTVNNVTPDFFVFSRDGKIRVHSTKQEIGTWYTENPHAKFGRGFVKKIYGFGLYYKGSWSAYTRAEMVETLINQVKIKGLQIWK